MKIRGVLFFAAALILSTGCGYSLQRSGSPQLARKGIRTIYIEPIVNNSYKPGIENVLYNSLLKAINARGGVRTVTDKDLADAVLFGTVSRADYIIASYTQAKDLNPTNTGPSNRNVATLYTAFLSASFHLDQTKIPRLAPKEAEKAEKAKVTEINPLDNEDAYDEPTGIKPFRSKRPPSRRIWSSGFSREINFNANTQLGILGTTAALINDSEFERALRDLSESMMADVHESMTALF